MLVHFLTENRKGIKNVAKHTRLPCTKCISVLGEKAKTVAQRRGRKMAENN